MRLAFKPLGGSFVSLIPDCSTGTGNLLLGIEVNHKRYKGLISDSSWFSYIFSSVFSHDTARWQFCKQIQSPFLRPDMMFSRAFSPCPYPRDRIFSLSDIPCCFASSKRYDIGSAPGDSTKIIGVVESESSNAAFRSNKGDSMNYLPEIDIYLIDIFLFNWYFYI